MFNGLYTEKIQIDTALMRLRSNSIIMRKLSTFRKFWRIPGFFRKSVEKCKPFCYNAGKTAVLPFQRCHDE